MKTTLIFLIILLTCMNMHTQSTQSDFYNMVEHAAMAPSGHNTQPWFFRINENSIEIHPDFTKTLPVVDGDNRELFVSLGCALENLCLSALQKGYQPTVNIDTTGVIIVIPEKMPGNPDENFLVEQIPLRQTNRRVYTGKKIPGDTLCILENSKCDEGTSIRFFENNTPEFNTIKEYIIQGNRLQMRDKEFKKELKAWMRFNRKHSESTKDGLSYSTFGAPNLPAFISKPIIGWAINENSQVKGDRKKITSASHLVLFSTTDNTPVGWVRLGRTLQRFTLQSTASGLAHSYFNQPNEIPELASAMAGELEMNGEYPVILIRLGYAEKMPYSKRKDVQDVLIK